MKKSQKTYCSVRIQPELHEGLLKIQKQRRGISKSELIEAAIKAYLTPESYKKRDLAIARSLERIERRIKVMEIKQEVIAETLSLFVKGWLTNTLELPEHEKPLAERAGGRRFKKFLEALTSRLKAGHTLFGDLPDDVFFKSEDFFEREEGGSDAETEDSSD